MNYCFQLPELLLIAIVANLITVDSSAQTKTLKFNTPVNDDIPGYFEYLPKDYSAQPETAFPLLIFMQGLGTAGNGSEDQLIKVVDAGWGTPPWRAWRDELPSSFVVNSKEMEFIIITPQFLVEPYYTFHTEKDINDLIFYAFDHYRVDHNKVYLAGQSAGGAYALNFVGSKDSNANKIAGVLVSSPGAKTEFTPTAEKGDIVSRNQIPVWIEVSELDASAPSDPGIYKRNSEAWINVINNTIDPPFYGPHLTILPGENAHGDAAATLFHPGIKQDGKNIYEWVLQFERGVALPVTFLQLKGTINGSSVLISWRTQSEKSSLGFIVQKSFDSKRFEDCGFVNSKNITNGTEYSFEIKEPFNGINYFRLEQIDRDGHKSYSKIVSVYFASSPSIVISPNPVHDLMTIKFNTQIQNATIRIFDNSGKLIKEVKAMNSSHQQIDVSALTKGFYTGLILSEEKTTSFSFIKN